MTKTLDQRQLILPPAWGPRVARQSVILNQDHGVFYSDRSRVLARKIVTAIDNAREMVVGCTFLLADSEIEDAFERAAKRGVRVYLMLAIEARLDAEIRPNREFDQHALEQNKRMLQRLSGWAMIRSSPSFHAKIVLVDPHREATGFLLTANLTQEALSRNEELGIELNSQECQEVFLRLRWAMWSESKHELLSSVRFSALGKVENVPIRPPSGGAIVSTLGKRGDLADTALSVVRSAKTSLVVCSFGWDLDHEVIQEICSRARAGVRVTALARIRAASMPALLALAEAGAQVLGYDFLHAKAIVADGSSGVVMSANLQQRGLDSAYVGPQTKLVLKKAGG